MGRPKPKFTPEPRIWSDFQVATRLGRSEEWLRQHRDKLLGFPPVDNELGGTDADAIEAWLDVRAGLIDTSAQPNPWDERKPA